MIQLLTFAPDTSNATGAIFTPVTFSTESKQILILLSIFDISVFPDILYARTFKVMISETHLLPASEKILVSWKESSPSNFKFLTTPAFIF